MDRGLELQVVKFLHSFFPIIAATYYFVACFVKSIASPLKRKPSAQQPKGLRLTLGCIMLLVLATYIFALASSLLWFSTILAYIDAQSPPGYPLYGCWILYFLCELALLSLSLRLDHARTKLSVITMISQAIRLCVLFLLPCTIFGSRLCMTKKVGDDEENTPLLRDSVNRFRGDGAENAYGSCNSRSNSIAEPHVSKLDPELNKEGEEEMKPRELNLWDFMKNLRAIVPFYWPSGKPKLQLLYLCIGICLVFQRIMNIVIPLQIGLITNILSKNDGTFPWREISFFIALRLFDSSCGLSAITKFLWVPLEDYSYTNLSSAAYNQIMALSSDYHDSKSCANLWQSVFRGQGVNNMVHMLCFVIGPMVIDLALAVSVLYYIFDAYMALDIAAIAVLFMWSSGKIINTQAKRRRQFVDNKSKEVAHMCETTANWYTVSYFNRISYEESRYASCIKDQLVSRRGYLLWVHMEESVQSLFLLLGLMIACFMAVHQVIKGTKPIGHFIMLLSYWAQLTGPLQLIAAGFGSLAMDMIDMEGFLELLRQKPTITNHVDAKPMRHLASGDIEFTDVTFSYDGKREVLNNVNFKVKAGQTVALVGQTGGGKTTILQMLNRFYDPTSGSVRIDGQDISQVTLESLRANIGVVPQHPALFDDTIMANIRYARLSATDEEIIEACKAVALHDRISTFTDAYNTLVGERGQKLSGGELQRVAIARAIIKNPIIVLLDEATSSMDSETEAHVQGSLNRLRKGRTTFIVAHRLSSVIHADKIMVVEGGKIVEEGNHRELLNRKGHYYRLCAFQGGFDIPGHHRARFPNDTMDNGENPLFRNDSDPATISPEGTASSGHSADQHIGIIHDGALGHLRQTSTNCASDVSARNPTSKKSWKPDAPDNIAEETSGDADLLSSSKENVPALARKRPHPELSLMEKGDQKAKSLSPRMKTMSGQPPMHNGDAELVQGCVWQGTTDVVSDSAVVLPKYAQRRREMTKSEPTTKSQNVDENTPLIDLETAAPSVPRKGQSTTSNQRRRRRYHNWSNSENRKRGTTKASIRDTGSSS
ncbi:heavy metal tolerance protein [Histoplasma capsulatum]|uniref:Heavy metal tolerance protein n=1 Tax=Ajellomyces capsulatus TaxID=5037 RepID=A0A8A1MJK8_AJECA|nr:heavy metal tolerance protein [Histoplasma capsulatum]